MIELKDVYLDFKTPAETVKVLTGLNFSLADGQTSAIVGPSGSGKTTLLNLIGALLPPTSGTVKVADTDLSSLTEPEAAQFRNRHLGFVFQQHHLLPQLSVIENVLVPRLAGGWDEPESLTRQRATDLLERVGLSHRLNHRPGELSGGEKQRTAVARALINQPRVLLADEPTGALDQESGNNIADLLLEIHREQNVTLVVVTHDLNLAQKIGPIFQLRQS